MISTRLHSPLVLLALVAAATHLNAQESRPAEPPVVAANQAVRMQLPFGD